MELTVSIKTKLNKEEYNRIVLMQREYVRLVNELVSKYFKEELDIFKLTTKSIENEILPTTCINNVIQDARSVVKTYFKRLKKYEKKLKTKSKRKRPLKEPNIPIIKKPICKWTNQQYKIIDNRIEFPIKPIINHKKTPRMSLQIKTDEYNSFIKEIDNKSKGILRITEKNGKMLMQMTYEVEEPARKQTGKVMGIDLGIKVPAVSYTNDGKIRFYGNGRQNKYIRRHYKYLAKVRQRSKNKQAVHKKEQRVMKDIDHKISRQIVNEAIKQGIKVIKMEQLNNIRESTRTSRKNNRNLHSWSFGRLQSYIEYKSKLAGIEVEYVNPKYTSQRCPKCGKLNHAKDREYKCSCGYERHRDVVGAINISEGTTESFGKRKWKNGSLKV